VAERHAEKLADDAELKRARTDAEAGRETPLDSLRLAAAQLCCRELSSAISAVLRYAIEKARPPIPGFLVERPWTDPAWQAPFQAATRATFPVFVDLCRDIFGNPFRPIGLDPSWQNPVVLALAQAAYDNRTLPAGTLEPNRLAVLADALEESGCADADILGHLRGPGPHVRGCFALDAILDKK
jgi:hypothetical protein